ncbi:TVP38/TMEM64 family protein [Acuticoccus sp. M5D2P5]|uniref:TVP38/TMEM64 family protein n=1 Tax=Acuticoccus kalidii TaxID=2910977 RepID=UPI001F479A01|nr:TVP38/TMEM64 family protein [Acuticoccus kalidii]MCF3932276.1 TVP38/TMEM64 family protein [Acuticoccus kalidii]
MNPIDDDTSAGKDLPPRATLGADRKRWRWWRLWPLVALAIATAAFYALGLDDKVSLTHVIYKREGLLAAVAANFVLMCLIYCAAYVIAVAVSFPGASLLTIIGGFLFGPFVATLLTIVSATLGGAIIFLAAKSSIGEALRARAGPAAQRLAEGFEADAFSYLLFLRLVPVFPFWLINVAPALFNVRLGTFLLATLLGIVPGTFVYAFLGSGLGGLIKAQEEADPGCLAAKTCTIDIGALWTWQIMTALAALSLLALVPVFVRRYRARRDPAAGVGEASQ